MGKIFLLNSCCFFYIRSYRSGRIQKFTSQFETSMIFR